ncbi:MAG: hypothetical protein ACI9HE_001050 [Planctomycetota bacterium]|jgi:hypothetical protein
MKRALLLTILIAASVGAGAWVARGIYDEVLLDEGVFHVVNACDEKRAIELIFPSAERRSAVLLAGQAVDFRVANTGEGAVTVMAGGEQVGSIGYVTSHNSLAVIVLKPEGALFSQVVRE